MCGHGIFKFNTLSLKAQAKELQSRFGMYPVISKSYSKSNNTTKPWIALLPVKTKIVDDLTGQIKTRNLFLIHLPSVL